MFIYTENNIESHRNTQNTNIYIAPKTKQHENTFLFYFKSPYFSKEHLKNQRCMMLCMALFIFYVERPHSLTSLTYLLIYVAGTLRGGPPSACSRSRVSDCRSSRAYGCSNLDQAETPSGARPDRRSCYGSSRDSSACYVSTPAT